ncbi:MAG: hypothetical protein AAGA96_06920 [Verrucomicrobiota bacterium]
MIGIVIVLSLVGSSRFTCAQEEDSTPYAVGREEARSMVLDIPAPEWGKEHQIRVFGDPPGARVLFAAFANEIRAEFRKLVYRFRLEEKIDRDSWKTPIRIEIYGDPTDIFLQEDKRLEVEIRMDNRLQIKVSARMHDRFDDHDFRLEILKTLILDQMLAPYSQHPSAVEGQELEAPEWLVHGFDRLIEHRQGGRPSAFFEGVLKSGQMLKPEELFSLADASTLDPVNFAIFRTSAAAMVEALLDQPKGDLALRSLLMELASVGSESTMPLLRKHFPAFREMEQGLEKWWVLQIATLGQQQGYEYLNREETEAALSEALTFRFDAVDSPDDVKEQKKKGFAGLFQRKSAPNEKREAFAGMIDQYDSFLDRADAEEKLVNCFNQIQGLKRSGFPLYRPVFHRYELVIERLAKGETEGIDVELADLDRLRRQIRETLIRAEDYLNYYEATRSPERSRAFDDYLKMRRSLRSDELPQRTDRISRQLDSVEAELEKGR